MNDSLLNLHLFASDGGDGGAGGDASGGADMGGNVTTAEAEARQAEFDEYINANKDLYDARVKKQLDRRFKETQRLQQDSDRLSSMQPMLELLSGRYGVDSGDLEALSRAIEDDNAFYEDAAFEAGMSVEQYKNMQRLERENAELHAMRRAQADKKAADETYARWTQQAEECARFYPSFDLKAELSGQTGQRLIDLLKRGVDVRTAYEVIHKDEIISGAMQRTAAVVQKKTVNDIRARGMRPQENGARSSAGVVIKQDPSKMSRKEREALARRAMRGERVTFT